MKKLGKALVLVVLSWQLKRLLKKHPVKVVGVVGSYGKTSTKLALVTVLQKGLRVQYQDGNYNDIVTVPLIFFGQTLPSLLNPIAWTRVFLANEKQITGAYPYDVVVVELGTDGPGQIAKFSRYLKLDMAVVSSLAYEHMEFFADIDAVAHEELAVQQLSDEIIANADLCDQKYLATITKPLSTFGRQQGTYTIRDETEQAGRVHFVIAHGDTQLVAECVNSSRSIVYSATAAAIVAEKVGMSRKQIQSAIAAIQPAPGRMRPLKGIHDVTILDDTYNASPEAVKASLDTLYASPSQHKIALLGNMNELGSFSADAHTDIGNYCDPSKLELVLTLGTDANTYLAEAARQRGCKVVEFTSPYAAGRYLVENLQPNTTVLAKGSQNGVFAEEAVKLILADQQDASQLVRQSAQWQKVKRQQFSDAA